MAELNEKTRNKKGRGYTKYNYTTKSIAELTGRSLLTIRNDIYFSRLKMDDFVNVCEYVLRFNKNGGL